MARYHNNPVVDAILAAEKADNVYGYEDERGSGAVARYPGGDPREQEQVDMIRGKKTPPQGAPDDDMSDEISRLLGSGYSPDTDYERQYPAGPSDDERYFQGRSPTKVGDIEQDFMDDAADSDMSRPPQDYEQYAGDEGERKSMSIDDVLENLMADQRDERVQRKLKESKEKANKSNKRV